MILLWSGKDYYELLEDAAQQKNYEIIDMSISLPSGMQGHNRSGDRRNRGRT